jgi:hypothetical protein
MLTLDRRYLPKMDHLKRIHLADVSMTSEQAIALAEILPEIKGVAHINLLENPELVKLADAKTEESQEEACALYASLLAATRVSKTIICVDVDVPSEGSGEIVKALAKQVVAYCLRNMERFPVAEIGQAVTAAMSDTHDPNAPIPYPDVLAHLVGHDIMTKDESDGDGEPAPDEDYVIGGTGVVKALQCCLKNRGDESRRQSGEFIREMESGLPSPIAPPPTLRSGKAKDMSKHLLTSARKIRVRLQPALSKAKAKPHDDVQNFRKLMFLDQTLAGIIKRFEDEFPDTRVEGEAASEWGEPEEVELKHTSTSVSAEVEPYPEATVPSDAEDDTELHVRPLSRSNSMLSTTSRALAQEEGRVLRAGHRFRSGIIKQEHYDLLNSSLEAIGQDPDHARWLGEMIDELGDEDLSKQVKEVGPIETFKQNRDRIQGLLKAIDPDHWERFKESQEKARANMDVSVQGVQRMGENATAQGESGEQSVGVDESAIAD